MLPLYALTLFVSAALLFCVQPMVAKMILPLLGGTPAVWNTCMVFFQAALLGGYLYSHLLTTRLGKRGQVIVHAFVLLLPLLVLPITIDDRAVASLSPTENPIPWALKVLILAVGLPFFVLSTSAPLLQKWFAGTGHPAAEDPYFLYGASNLGSMLALGSYPVLVEPALKLAEQRQYWAVAYGILLVLILACGVAAWVKRKERGEKWEEEREPKNDLSVGKPPEHSFPSVSSSPLSASLSTETPTLGRRLRWIALAFVPSSLMLGVTTYLTTDIAAIPLLWVIPLSLYLLTFIIVFARKPLLRHQWMNYAMVVGAVVFPVLYYNKLATLEWMTVHLIIFFVVSMYCHGELAKDRPSTEHLTEFYLWMSFGGVLGGMFNALVAPLVFNQTYEYPIAMVIACLLRPWPKGAKYRGFHYSLDIAIPSVIILFLILIKGRMPQGSTVVELTTGIIAVLILGSSTLLAWSLWERAIDSAVAFARAPSRHLFSGTLSQVRRLRPLALAFVPASLMISMPFALDTRTTFPPLKIITAALYAVTLLLAFARPAFLVRRQWIGLAMAVAVVVFPIPYYFRLPLFEWVLFHMAIFFVVSLYCHSELTKELLQPAGRTLFLWAVVGGVLGVAFSLSAPVILSNRIFEFPIAMVIACLLRPWPVLSIKGLHAVLDFAVPPAIILITMFFLTNSASVNVSMTTKNWAILIGVLATVSLIFINRPLRFGLAMAVLLLATEDNLRVSEDRSVMHRTRSFFGVLKVSGGERYRTLVHGNILHGRQDFGDLRREPGTYYYRTGPLGDVMRVFANHRSKPNIAAIGLGTGSVAAYPKKGERLTFYEIDPAVVRIAGNPEYFTYVKDCEGELNFVLGDARLRLKDAPDGEYGVIIVDAFSSDSIPIHLLTKEAIELYFKKLAPGGILALHISNRYLNLRPVVAELALDGGYVGRVRTGSPTAEERRREYSHAEWVVFVRQEADLGDIADDPKWEPLWEEKRGPVWTDDFSNVFGILRFRWRRN